MKAFVFLFLNLTCAHLGHASEPSVETMKDSVVVITGEAGCGTGFVLPSGKIVTNAHVMDQDCSQEHCSDVELSQAKTIGGEPTPFIRTDFDVIVNFPHADLAIIKPVVATSLKGFSGRIRAPKPGETFFIMGFPHCKKLEVASGKISGIQNFEFTLGLPIAKGQSGSPVFGENFDIIGVVNKVNDQNIGMATRVDHLGANFEEISRSSEILELNKIYDAVSQKINSKANLNFSSFWEVKDAEIQLALSGFCPGLKDYWLWIHAGLPKNIPPPHIEGNTLSGECYTLFHSSVKFEALKLFSNAESVFSFAGVDRDKLSLLEKMSPMAYFAEGQYFQDSLVENTEDLFSFKDAFRVKKYAYPVAILGGTLTTFLMIFFVLFFLARKIPIFKKILFGVLLTSLVCTLMSWWLIK